MVAQLTLQETYNHTLCTSYDFMHAHNFSRRTRECGCAHYQNLFIAFLQYEKRIQNLLLDVGTRYAIMSSMTEIFSAKATSWSLSISYFFVGNALYKLKTSFFKLIILYVYVQHLIGTVRILREKREIGQRMRMY